MRVIVQKTSAGASASGIVARVQGVQVVRRIQGHPGLCRDVPISAIPALARDPNVRYLSPDGDVQILPGLRRVHLKPLPSPQSHRPRKPPKAGIDPANLLTTYPFDTGATGAWSSADGHVETGSKSPSRSSTVASTPRHPDVSGQVSGRQRQQEHAVDRRRLRPRHPRGGHHQRPRPGRPVPGHRARTPTVISVKVADDSGSASESDLLRGLDWVDANRDDLQHPRPQPVGVDEHPESYATSPIDAAVENLWHDGVTVVASAGNLGSAQDAVWYAPGNDP